MWFLKSVILIYDTIAWLSPKFGPKIWDFVRFWKIGRHHEKIITLKRQNQLKNFIEGLSLFELRCVTSYFYQKNVVTYRTALVAGFSTNIIAFHIVLSKWKKYPLWGIPGKLQEKVEKMVESILIKDTVQLVGTKNWKFWQFCENCKFLWNSFQGLGFRVTRTGVAHKYIFFHKKWSING